MSLDSYIELLYSMIMSVSNLGKCYSNQMHLQQNGRNFLQIYIIHIPLTKQVVWFN